MRTIMLASGALLAALSLETAPAHAGTIATDQWYAFGFGSTIPSAVFSPGVATGIDGPLLNGGTASSVPAPTGTSWLITLASSGYVTFTDLQETGDRFQVFVNGSAAIPVTGTLIPSGHAGLTGGYTSVPQVNAFFDNNDIGASLSDPRMSSGTFYLPAGTDTLSADYIGGIGNGDAAFIVEAVSVPVPEPAAIALIGTGALALGLVRRRRA